MSSDTSHTVCPVKAANPGAHDQWYVDEGKRCERVTKAYLQRIRVADVHYPTRLVEGALMQLPTEGPTRVKNAYKALAHVVMGALRQFAVDAEVPDELLFLARPRFWTSVAQREVDSTKTKKVLCTFSECPEGDTVTNFESKYNGERCKHHGESLDVPEPACFPSAFPDLLENRRAATAVGGLLGGGTPGLPFRRPGHRRQASRMPKLVQRRERQVVQILPRRAAGRARGLRLCR